MRFIKRRTFSICLISRCLRLCARVTLNRAASSPLAGITLPSKQIGENLVARSDIDLIDIATPNDTHAEIAIGAAKAGKMVMCEKPLGRTAAEARRDGGGGRAVERPQHGLVQLPARARRDAC